MSNNMIDEDHLPLKLEIYNIPYIMFPKLLL